MSAASAWFGISVEFAASPAGSKRLVRDFVPALRHLVEQVKERRQGVPLILDDINGMASSLEFANWFKSMVDEIATSQRPLPLFLLVVGLEERRQSLIELQPSLARVFDLVEMRAWSEAETRAFYAESFGKAGIAVDDKAMHTLLHFTGGLPVLAHEIGDAAYDADTDNRIDFHDASLAIERAADIVGRKHLQPQVFAAIRSVRYRDILGKLASLSLGQEMFRRADVLPLLDGNERTVLDNFLRKMTSLGVLGCDAQRGAGVYRFRNKLHELYFALEAARSRNATAD